MARIPLLRFGVLIVTLVSSIPLFAQGKQFDIEMEGPWLFYPVNNVQLTTSGTKYDALIAVAPVVSGHYNLVFTSGTGAQADPGIYCLGFDAPCSLTTYTPNAPPIMSNPYSAFQYVPITDDNASWAAKAISRAMAKQAYVLILPVPALWSADGTYTYDFEKNPPTPTPMPLNNRRDVAIGTQLHYNQGTAVTNFVLTSCSANQTSSTPMGTVFTCSTPPPPQKNSGTLRIAIKSPEYFGQLAKCDHHVMLAYHSMVDLIPASAANQPNSYIFDPNHNTAACLVCDPQQSSLDDECLEETPMLMIPTVAEIHQELGKLTQLLPVTNSAQNCADLPPSPYEREKLECLTTALSGGVANQQTLATLYESLQESRQELLDTKAMMKQNMSAQLTNNFAPASKAAALAQIRTLIPQVGRLFMAATSGKDCRAPQMAVQ